MSKRRPVVELGLDEDVTTTRLPPLTSLRAFESAGRALSFTLAADELGVTPGAVSRQIKVLEDFLGIRLFVRSGRDVSLTKAGVDYLAQLVDAFAQIRAATSQLTSVSPEVPLRVSTSITFTLRWLVPRLMNFHSLQPDSNLQLTMNLAEVDFQRDELDATIKLGHENTSHAVVRKLFDADLVAVCSPRLLQDGRQLDSITALDGLTLLHSTARPRNWENWLAEAGHPDIVGAHQLHFESSSLAYQAAVEGVGVAIAQLPLALDDLRNGVLLTPFPITTPDDDVYNLIWPDRSPRTLHFKAFRDWMMSEARQTARQVALAREDLSARRAAWVQAVS
jgi:LysR family glycine cleavage system transcriptional activator